MKVRVIVVDIQFSVCVCGCGSILLEKKMLDLLVICFSCCCALRAVGVLADVMFFLGWMMCTYRCSAIGRYHTGGSFYFVVVKRTHVVWEILVSVVVAFRTFFIFIFWSM